MADMLTPTSSANALSARGTPLFSRLYVRIWLAVVVFLALLMGGTLALLKIAKDDQRKAQATQELIVRDSQGNVLTSLPIDAFFSGDEDLVFEIDTTDLLLHDTVFLQLPPPALVNGRPAWFNPAQGMLGMLAMISLALALGAYPIVRGLTRRLERLRQAMQRWGAGDLTARAPVHGRDEVALLAQGFNAAATQVQTLLQSHKQLLANASHELRSPMARLHMALAMTGQDDPANKWTQEVQRNLSELDQLIDEILLSSRLEASALQSDKLHGQDLFPMDSVDIAALTAEEAARIGAALHAPSTPVVVQGSATLLRRLLRNLLENAKRYGLPNGMTAEDAITVRLDTQQNQITVQVSDRGPGVPLALRERVFEPFFRLPGASEESGGVGLGLSLVQSIAKQHGGIVRCTEHTGGGACFEVTLPLQNKHSPASRPIHGETP